ncbi:MAG TPA: carboxypeptidase regulatory-like domain-containing protein [Bryobacteraceae bacterium]|nr:carboxypeptidase regulatory-like domain-containing protein [Bryobacteraceae bacterium]
MFSSKQYLLVFMALLCSLPTPAQYVTGRVEGTVFDATGAVVQGATVRLTSEDTNRTREFETGMDGVYFFAALPAGRYRVSVDKAGFATATADVMALTSQTTTQDIGLRVGDQPTTIEVVAETTPQLNSFEPLRSVTRATLELQTLPNAGRNIINVISLSPGVIPTFNPRGGQLVTLTGAQAGQISANGGRSKATSHQLDYVDANDWEFGGIALGTQPTPDMMQEFKILTNNWAAEYGLKASAQVIMVTRTGSNALHGTAYNFLQNSALNARDYFDRTGESTPLRQNIFGFTVGGPVWKDRTFLFGGYEGRETRGAGSTVIATLPTAAARATATDPAVQQTLQLLPLPTGPGPNANVGTLASQLTSPSSSDQFIARGDHYFTSNHSIAARYYQNVGTALNRLAGGTLPGFDATFDPVGRNAMVSDTWVIGPRSTNELRAAYGRSSALFQPETDPATPRFVVTGLVSFGTVNNWPQGRIFNVYQLNDVFTHVRGRHILKAGFDLRHIQDNSVNDSNRRGVYTFASLDDFLHGRLSNFTQLYGNTYRGFRTNFHAFFVQDDWKVTPSLTVNLGLRYEYQGGLREVNGLQSVLDPSLNEAVGQAGTGALGAFRRDQTVVDRNPALVAPRFGFAWRPGNGDWVVRGGYGIYFDSAIFNGLQAGRTTPPTNYTGNFAGSQLTGPNGLGALLAGTAPVQQQFATQVGTFGTLRNFGRVVSSLPQLRNPYMQHFSFGVQRKFGDSLVADVSYVGTKGTALTTYGPANSVLNRPAPATSLADEQTRLAEFQAAVGRQNGENNTRLDPRFNDVDVLRDNGSSIYHSLQTEVRQSYRWGLTFRASYTWSKSIDNSSDYSPGQNPVDTSFPQSQFNLRSERAVSSFDIPHRFLFSHVWNIPVFRDQRGVVGRILGGWTFASVNQVQSGIPATILAGSRLGIVDTNMDGNQVGGLDNARANCTDGVGFEFGNPATIPAPAARGIGNSANTSNFRYTQPLLGNNGTCGRNTFRMNRLVNFDWTFAKQIRLFESGPLGSGPYGLEFRTDFFNIFNVPFLTATGNEWRNVSSPQFGLYNAAGPARRIQMALRLTF